MRAGVGDKLYLEQLWLLLNISVMLVMLSTQRQFLFTHQDESYFLNVKLKLSLLFQFILIVIILSEDKEVQTKLKYFDENWIQIYKTWLIEFSCQLWFYQNLSYVLASCLYRSSCFCCHVLAAKVVIMKLQTNQNHRKVITNNVAPGDVSTWSSS